MFESADLSTTFPLFRDSLLPSNVQPDRQARYSRRCCLTRRHFDHNVSSFWTSIQNTITITTASSLIMPAAEFVFVTTGSFGKPESADRSLIRSRCMRGRNAREGSRRSVRQAKRDAQLQDQAMRLQPLVHPLPTNSTLPHTSLLHRDWAWEVVQESVTDGTDQGKGTPSSDIVPWPANNRVFSQFDAEIDKKSRLVQHRCE